MRRGERLPTAINGVLRDRARGMRRKMTPAEVKLWSRIRGDQIGGLRFRFCKRKRKAIKRRVLPIYELFEVNFSHRTCAR